MKRAGSCGGASGSGTSCRRSTTQCLHAPRAPGAAAGSACSTRSRSSSDSLPSRSASRRPPCTHALQIARPSGVNSRPTRRRSPLERTRRSTPAPLEAVDVTRERGSRDALLAGELTEDSPGASVPARRSVADKTSHRAPPSRGAGCAASRGSPAGAHRRSRAESVASLITRWAERNTSTSPPVDARSPIREADRSSVAGGRSRPGGQGALPGQSQKEAGARGGNLGPHASALLHRLLLGSARAWGRRLAGSGGRCAARSGCRSSPELLDEDVDRAISMRRGAPRRAGAARRA